VGFRRSISKTSLLVNAVDGGGPHASSRRGVLSLP
jgi:hypothetical protein